MQRVSTGHTPPQAPGAKASIRDKIAFFGTGAGISVVQQAEQRRYNGAALLVANSTANASKAKGDAPTAGNNHATDGGSVVSNAPAAGESSVVAGSPATDSDSSTGDAAVGGAPTASSNPPANDTRKPSHTMDRQAQIHAKGFPPPPSASVPDFKTEEGRRAFRDLAVECFSGTKMDATMQSPQDALIALADLGNLEREIAGEKMPPGYEKIRRQFLDPHSGMAEFIQNQPPGVQTSILRALASKNCDIAMKTLLGKNAQIPKEFFNDLYAAGKQDATRTEAIGCFYRTADGTTQSPPEAALKALIDIGDQAREAAREEIPHGFQEIQQQFLNPESKMAEFIQRQPLGVQICILHALASKNAGIAMAALLGASRVEGMPIRKDFFDDLCADSSEGRKFTDLDATGLIGDSDNRIQSREERLNSKKSDVRAGEDAIKFLATEPEPGGAKFFGGENFERNLEVVARLFGSLTIFKDINRLSNHMTLTINGHSVDLSNYVSETDSGGIKAAKFVLMALKNSGFTPEQAFNVFQALCRFQYAQGECTRPLMAYKLNLGKAADSPAADSFSKNIFTHGIRANTLAINMTPEGNVEMDAGVMISSKYIDEFAQNNPDKGSATHCPHTYGVAFTSAVCDPQGNHQLKSSMMACNY
jgi:hypothetical protein